MKKYDTHTLFMGCLVALLVGILGGSLLTRKVDYSDVAIAHKIYDGAQDNQEAHVNFLYKEWVEQRKMLRK